MNYQFIRYETNYPLAYITLARPEKRNALHPQLVTELKDAFTKSAEEEEVRVVILRAEGKVFCAGADLAYLQSLQSYTYEENLADSQHLMELYQQIYQNPKPVIAQVQGHAIAGGCGLATVCDFIFAVEEALFGYTEVKIGFIPAIVMVFLVRKLGEARARQLLLSGDLMNTTAAKNMGLVFKKVTAKKLPEEVEEFAQRIVKENAPSSMQLTKELLVNVQNMPLEEALQAATASNAKTRENEDCRKGIGAFLNREKIVW